MSYIVRSDFRNVVLAPALQPDEQPVGGKASSEPGGRRFGRKSEVV